MPPPSHPPRPRLKLRDVRWAFRVLAEVRCRGDDPAEWRPFMAKALVRLFRAEIVVSSEIYLRPTGDPGAWDVVDIGWGADASGGAWRIEHRHRETSPQTYDLLVHPRAAIDPDGRAAVVPSRRMRGGSAFVLSSISLPHISAVDQLGMHRAHGTGPFNPTDHRLLRLLHAELARFWRKDVLARAQDPRSSLPPRLVQTLRLLVDGRSEKEIAAAIGISAHTVHNYVKALHQRFNVSSRGELIAAASRGERDLVPKLSVTVHRPKRARGDGVAAPRR